MKTTILSFFLAVALQPLFAQIDLASASGVAPREPNDAVAEDSETVISAFSHTVDGMAFISLGRGLLKPVNLQILTPNAGMLIDREIPAGQTRIKVDLAGLPEGTYTVRINLGDKMWVKQIVKN